MSKLIKRSVILKGECGERGIVKLTEYDGITSVECSFTFKEEAVIRLRCENEGWFIVSNYKRLRLQDFPLTKEVLAAVILPRIPKLVLMGSSGRNSFDPSETMIEFLRQNEGTGIEKQENESGKSVDNTGESEEAISHIAEEVELNEEVNTITDDVEEKVSFQDNACNPQEEINVVDVDVAAAIGKDEEPIIEVIQSNEKVAYENIKPKLEEMFHDYPSVPELNAAVPLSKWIRVDYDENAYYVIGVLSNTEGATHLVYGVRGDYDAPPPFEAEWLPLNTENWSEEGYWVVYQELT